MERDRDRRTDAVPDRRRRQYRLSRLMVAIAGVALGFWLLRLPGVGFLVAGALTVIGVTLSILLGAMALGWLGIGLFALFDRLIAWSRREPQWFQPTSESNGWATEVSEEHQESAL